VSLRPVKLSGEPGLEPSTRSTPMTITLTGWLMTPPRSAPGLGVDFEALLSGVTGADRCSEVKLRGRDRATARPKPVEVMKLLKQINRQSNRCRRRGGLLEPESALGEGGDLGLTAMRLGEAELDDRDFGFGWDGFGRDGFGWDGFGWDGFGWDGFGWDILGWDIFGVIKSSHQGKSFWG
jgi:hypothetical protein